MGPPNISIGTHLETGQGSGTLIEGSREVGIEGSGYFVWGALHSEQFH